MNESVESADNSEQKRSGVVKHALSLFGVAALIYTTYIVYVFAFTMNN